MEQGANAPAVPAANGKLVRGLGWALACAFGLQTMSVSAVADSGLHTAAGAGSYMRLALVANRPVEHMPAAFHFTPAENSLSVSADTVSRVLAPRLPGDAVSIPPVKPASVTAALPRAAAKPQKPTLLFGSLGKSVALTPVSARWERALGGITADDAAGAQDRARLKAYRAILGKLENERRGLQIPKVNYMVNRLLAYRDDARLWQAGEYWASPAESLSRRAGDCEDYAILKYALLRDLGVADADMRIVVLRDTAARQHHAVLSVRHNGTWLILDNRFSRVRFERDLPNYQALYSVNAAGAWSHVPATGAPVRLAQRLNSATR